MKYWLFWAILGSALNAEASTLYRCVDGGQYAYQDRPCAVQHPDNQVWTWRSKARGFRKPYRTASNSKPACTEKNTGKRAQVALSSPKYPVWHQRLCEHAITQKKQLRARLRRGYRIGQYNQLHEKLKDCEIRERRYCQNRGYP